MHSRADAAPAWLWVPALAGPGARIAFESDDQHYLKRVCRARPGDQAHLTDGRGAVARARLELNAGALTAVIESQEIRRRARHCTVLCGAPESGRADWLIEKLGELGVAVFQPVNCERGDWSRADARIDRWQRLAVAALRQSQRAFLLEVRPPCDLSVALEAVPAGVRLWLADPGGEPAARPPAEAGEDVGLVGPASGFSDGERTSILGRGARAMALSDGRLRTETAAMAWSAWWSGAGT